MGSRRLQKKVVEGVGSLHLRLLQVTLTSTCCRVRGQEMTGDKSTFEVVPSFKDLSGSQAIRESVNSDSQPTLSSRQAKSANRRPPRDTEWTSQFVLPAPREDDGLSNSLQAIKKLGDGGEDLPMSGG